MEIKCSQCGAGIEVSPESGFIICPYCDSRLYLEEGKSVKHYYLKPALKPEQIPSLLNKELSKLELTQPAELIKSQLIYLPFWLIKLKEQILYFPASGLEIMALRSYSFPVGELVPYEPELEQKAKIEAAELALDTLLLQLGDKLCEEKIEKVELIHIPFYHLEYNYQAQQYQAMIDAGTGRLYADKLPSSATRTKDRYFLSRFAILSVVFLLEAFFIPNKFFWALILGYILTGTIAWYLLQKEIKQRGY